MQAVLCGGEIGPLSFVRDRLELGGPLGEIPAAAPAVPLRRELEAEEKRLRLKRSDEIKTLDLDLREPTDGRAAGCCTGCGCWRSTGPRADRHRQERTFHELWQLRWLPDLEIAVVEASRWGSTIAAAAGARAIDLANNTEELGPLTEILDQVVVAELDEALGRVLAIVQARAAVASDVIHLAAALPRLARLSRYGDVRGLAAAPVLTLFDGSTSASWSAFRTRPPRWTTTRPRQWRARWPRSTKR
jgi:hypothetical protein